MKMYSSKYALTSGIKEFEPREAGGDGKYVLNGSFSLLKVGREAFHTREEAVADAVARRVKRIASLRKRIKVLETLTF